MAFLIKNMEEIPTLQNATDTVIDKPVSITVDIANCSRLLKLLQRCRLYPKQKIFLLTPIYLGTLIKISKILLSIEFKVPEGENKAASLLEANYAAIQNHAGSMAEIVALAIQNNSKEVDKALVKFVVNNFTSKEMLGVLAMVLDKMDLTNFMRTIISIRGLNVMDSQKAAPAENADN